jgi:hypothetical protein
VVEPPRVVRELLAAVEDLAAAAVEVLMAGVRVVGRHACRERGAAHGAYGLRGARSHAQAETHARF